MSVYPEEHGQIEKVFGPGLCDLKAKVFRQPRKRPTNGATARRTCPLRVLASGASASKTFAGDVGGARADFLPIIDFPNFHTVIVRRSRGCPEEGGSTAAFNLDDKGR